MAADPAGHRRAPAVAVPTALTVLVVLAALLAGCASLPTTGPVTSGPPAEAGEPREYRVAPVGPRSGAGPASIVAGFLSAAVGSPDDFAAARSHLVPERQRRWRPGQRVVVHHPGRADVAMAQGGRALGPDVEPDPAGGPVDVEVTAAVVATVDIRGVYQPIEEGATEVMRLQLTHEGGEWRIAAVPDQLLIDVNDFALTWRPRPLYFPSADGTRLVPEVRWFADRASTPTSVVTELLAGPSTWLAPATLARHAEGVGLAGGGVPVDDGEAQVDLAASVLGTDARTRALLVQQLEATLQPLPGVVSVAVTAEGGALTEAPTRAPARAGVTVDPAAVVLAQGVPHRWAGGAPEPVTGLALPDQPAGPLDAPAVHGRSVAALAAGRTVLLRWDGVRGEGSDAQAVAPATALTAPAGSRLTPPSFDPQGWVWSTATTSDGTVTAAARDGSVAVVDAPWLAGRSVVSLRASREGARLVVASTAADGSDVRVDLVGVARGAGGAPRALAVPRPSVTPWLASVTAAVWVDQTTIAVLGRRRGEPGGAPAPTEVFLLTGGAVTTIGAPGPEDPGTGGPAVVPELVGLAAGDGVRTLLLSSSDGRVFQRAGARWAPVAALAGTSAPAYAG